MNGRNKIIKPKSIDTFKTLLFTNWNVIRWIRLAIGLALLYQAVTVGSALFGVFSAFFLAQTIANTGCGFASACSAPVRENGKKIEDVQYEEIKSKN